MFFVLGGSYICLQCSLVVGQYVGMRATRPTEIRQCGASKKYSLSYPKVVTVTF